MKLLFFSPESSEVEEVGKEFTHAGIACEVRNAPPVETQPDSVCSELWIHNDCDSHRATMLCVQLGLGFARRDKTFGCDS